MKIPKTLKVGSRNIKVVIDERTGNDGFNGTAWVDDGVIFIDTTKCQELKEITFLHEILHIILHQLDFKRAKFDNPEEQDEHLCKILSNSLHQVLQDNNLLK